MSHFDVERVSPLRSIADELMSMKCVMMLAAEYELL